MWPSLAPYKHNIFFSLLPTTAKAVMFVSKRAMLARLSHRTSVNVVKTCFLFLSRSPSLALLSALVKSRSYFSLRESTHVWENFLLAFCSIQFIHFIFSEHSEHDRSSSLTWLDKSCCITLITEQQKIKWKFDFFANYYWIVN